MGLRLKQGVTWTPTMTFAMEGVNTRVTSPILEVRKGEDVSSELVLRCDDSSSTGVYITQTVDGVMEFNVPWQVTVNLEPGRWYYDFFGIVDGNRICLAETDSFVVESSVTEGS